MKADEKEESKQVEINEEIVADGAIVESKSEEDVKVDGKSSAEVNKLSRPGTPTPNPSSETPTSSKPGSPLRRGSQVLHALKDIF